MSNAICIDWGSTNLRAWLVRDGRVVDFRHSDRGMKSVVGKDGFEGVFDDITRGWQDMAQGALLSGMVTSRGGWVETPYLPLPAHLPDLARHGITLRHGALTLVFLPGLAQSDPCDVMRGEELALAGLARAGERQIAVLPGTHSKWVELDGNTVIRFRTLMTGELFELARHQSLAGRLAHGDAFDPDAFEEGVGMAGQGAPIANLFLARSRILLGDLLPEQASSYLSGLLIGSEIHEARRLLDLRDGGVVLSASDTLTEKYALALRFAGLECRRPEENPVLAGFLRVLAAPEALPGLPATACGR